MFRRIAYILLISIALVFAFSILASQYDVRSDAAYAQGAFGRRSSGSVQDNNSTSKADDDANKAEEVRKAEDARKADDARRAEEARKAEEVRKADEVRRAGEAKLAQERRLRDEQARKIEETRRAEELRVAEEHRKQEQIRKTDQRRREDEARQADERRRLQEAKIAQERQRQEDEHRQLEARQTDERLKQEEARRVEEAKKQAEATKLAQARLEEARRRNQTAGDAGTAKPIPPTTSRTDSGHNASTYPGGRKVGDTGKYDRVGERKDDDRRRDRRHDQPPIIIYQQPEVIVVQPQPAPEPIPVYIPVPSPGPEPTTAPTPPMVAAPDNPEPTVEPAPAPIKSADRVSAPAAESPEEAARLVTNAWKEQDPWLVKKLLPDGVTVSVDSEKGHRELSASDFYSETAGAMTSMQTIDFTMRLTGADGNEIRADGEHTYRTQNGSVAKVKVRYYFTETVGGWVLVRVVVSKTAASPARDLGEPFAVDPVIQIGIAARVATIACMSGLPMPTAQIGVALAGARINMRDALSAKMAEN